MSTAQFDSRFATYIAQAQEARREKKHHDYRRSLFLAFLRDAFGIDQGDIDVEKYIQIAGHQVENKGAARVKKGWIDAVFHDLIFEFKRDLEAERAEGLRELRDYLTTIPNGAESVGLLADGLQFVAYVLDAKEPTGLRETDSINLETAQSHVAYTWLDAYLLSQRNLAPTAADIVRRFGVLSPTFIAASRLLHEALQTFGASEAGALEVKRQQWAFYLARVYGSADVSNNDMFVRHTYLCQFAKLLAFTARFGIGEATSRVEQIIDGTAFEVLGVNNIGEQDFFAWVLAPEVRIRTLGTFQHIIASFAAYDLSRIDEDLLKQLYQDLVGAETRHDLGEFYTPDWLAELTLREINYRPGQSLLDPSCGSGAFLFSAIRQLVAQGITGPALVDFALDNIMGMDVHPLAVTVAKINYMLAILPHLQQGSHRGQRAIPIALANSLQIPTKSYRISVIEVPFDGQRSFQIPAEAARHPGQLAEVLTEMGRFASHAAKTLTSAKYSEFGNHAISKLQPTGDAQDIETERLMWNTNARWLAEQIANGRDSIWVYVLQNTSQPLILRYRKFDVVVGNPPWIAYRYLQDAAYQRDVKTLFRQYGLLDTKDTKLNTQIELATLFYEHCWSVYLKPGGTIAFVMPRSVITGAKQHHAFQQHGFTRVLDVAGVSPLFGVPTCVLIRSGTDVRASQLPTTTYAGRLPDHECKWAVAAPLLREVTTKTDFVSSAEIASPYYYPKMINGATLYPRNLVFVTSAQPVLTPGQLAHTSIMRTDLDLDAEAKAPWKGLKLEGHIDEEFLYATLLSKHLVPFGIGRLHLAALPVRIGKLNQFATAGGATGNDRYIEVSLMEMRDSVRFARSADTWFEPAEQLWQEHKKETTKESLAEWLNYQSKLTAQSPAAAYLVVYNAAGSNLAAAVLDTSHLPIINGCQPKGFVLDHTAYWYRAATPAEAHFLVALLNTPCVDAAIKKHQTRGMFGARHIHRRPFEVCPIPEYNPSDPIHQELARLSQEAHHAVAALALADERVVAARKKAREAARTYLNQIDAITQQLLGLGTAVNELGDAEEIEEMEEAEEA